MVQVSFRSCLCIFGIKHARRPQSPETGAAVHALACDRVHLEDLIMSLVLRPDKNKASGSFRLSDQSPFATCGRIHFCATLLASHSMIPALSESASSWQDGDLPELDDELQLGFSLGGAFGIERLVSQAHTHAPRG